MKLDAERREYRYGRLDRDTLADSPFDQFDTWMTQALDAGIQDPTAMTVSTVGKDGRPWTRIVLLKGFDDTGLYFYTGLESRKAIDIAGNKHVVLHFPWLAMDRQVIIGGTALQVSHDRASAYFSTRPRESQLAAWAVPQGTQIASREALDAAYQEVVNRFEGQDVPMPPHWGGFQVTPTTWEFWQGGEHRLHDRFTYTQTEDTWPTQRIAP